MRAAPFLLSVCLACPALAAQQDQATPLEVRKIVLYKHGVGYFEREGRVTGAATVPLYFKAAEMKDVLKSLYAVDLDGGRIASIVYDSKDPIEKQLEDILFRVPEANVLTRLLTQLKGARVAVDVGTRRIEGSILGIEEVAQKTEAGTAPSFKLVLLRADGAIEPLELLDASQVSILDDAVRRDLARMLEIYAKARYADRKVVQLHAAGDGARRIRAGYITATPIWKTSYRLLLDGDRPAALQGWAIVENRTDEDWSDVALSFVAGSPLSFVLDLYTSYYPARPVLDMAIAAAAPPPPADRAPSRSRRGRVLEELESARPQAESDDFYMGQGFVDKLAESLAPAAEGVEVGDLFAYEATHPVSIAKGQAALVPILFERLPESRRVLWFRRDFSEHPAHAMRMQNSTSLTLERGPVTVFEGATCLGEAMLQRTLGPGMHEVLPYALETGVEVEIAGDTRARPATRGVLRNGVLTVFTKQVRETRYTVRNKGDDAAVLLLDHQAAGGGFALVVPPEPAERLPGHLRFELAAPAGGEVEHVVREEREVSSQVVVANESAERIRFFASQRYLDDETRALLERVGEIMARRTAITEEVTRLRDERKQLVEDQENLRRNIGVLRDSPEERKLRERYVQRLTGSMEQVDAIDERAKEKNAELQRLDEELRRALE